LEASSGDCFAVEAQPSKTMVKPINTNTVQKLLRLNPQMPLLLPHMVKTPGVFMDLD
jgi:hypothetical protein